MNQKSSCIDHMYISNPTTIKNLKSAIPPLENYPRKWQKYTKEALIGKVSSQNWNIYNDDVQGYWNYFESKLVKIADQLLAV